MNVMLTRLPDGTVNAEPGDAVEYWSKKYQTWVPTKYIQPGIEGYVELSLGHNRDGGYMLKMVKLAHVRHVRGGAGHLRLQVARLRAFIEKEFGAMERFEDLTEGDYKRGVNAMAHINRVAAENAIDDIDKYEYTEPEE